MKIVIKVNGTRGELAGLAAKDSDLFTVFAAGYKHECVIDDVYDYGDDHEPASDHQFEITLVSKTSEKV